MLTENKELGLLVPHWRRRESNPSAPTPWLESPLSPKCVSGELPKTNPRTNSANTTHCSSVATSDSAATVRPMNARTQLDPVRLARLLVGCVR